MNELRGPRNGGWAAFDADVHPFAPFDDGNPLLGLVSFEAMHLLCVGVGMLGLMGFYVRYQVEGSGS